MAVSCNQTTPAGVAVDRREECPFCSGALFIRYRLDNDNKGLLETIYIFCTKCDKEYEIKTYIRNTDDYNKLIRNYVINTSNALENFYKSNFQKGIANIDTDKDLDPFLYSIDDLLNYVQSKMKYTFSVQIEDINYTKLYLNIKCFTYKANIYEGWFEKSYNIPFTKKNENGKIRYQTRKENIDKTIELFKKDLLEFESSNSTFKNRIKNDGRIQIWLAITIISIISALIYPFYELSLEEKFYAVTTWLFLYSLISLIIASINNKNCKRQCECFPISFFIIHTIAAIPYILLILYNNYF